LAVVPVVILAIGQSADASVPPTEPPGDGAGAIPVDVVELVDDTGTITVQVPSSWTDVVTAPLDDRPFIAAAEDLAVFHETFDIPGVEFLAASFAADTEAAVQAFGLTGGCADSRIEPYDDGAFVGSHLIYSECGGANSPAEFHVIAANPENQAFTAVLRIQIIGPDQREILSTIVETFNVAPGGATGSSAPAISTPPTIGPTTGGVFPPPTGDVPPGWTTLVDDTQTIAIAAPPSWTAIDTRPGENADGTAQPLISATTDAELFPPAEGAEVTESVPGVAYGAAPLHADTAELLETSTLHDVCSADPVSAYDDGVFVGHIQSFRGCRGTYRLIYLVAANPTDDAFTAVVIIQLTGDPDDAATLDGLLSSFNAADTASEPPTTNGPG
jgi:hypothetical protein